MSQGIVMKEEEGGCLAIPVRLVVEGGLILKRYEYEYLYGTSTSTYLCACTCAVLRRISRSRRRYVFAVLRRNWRRKSIVVRLLVAL